ncbi:hypothetical protein TrVFT333_009105 [Trichoderma virens FT-333]|nr:hypothetical protein TrVFT333_009105 [Trichoderma virens FT-333]
MAPVCLLTMPDEILLMICEKFCSHCDAFMREWDDENSKSLLSLVQTCRHLRGIAQPVQYHDVRFRDPLPFLRALLQRPDLAAQVRRFNNVEVIIPELSEKDVKSLEEAALRLPINEFELWLEAIMESNIDSYQRLLELTLALLPNAETLVLEGPYYYEHNVDSSITESILMESVSSLELSLYGSVDPSHRRDFLAMMPCLKRLKIHQCRHVSQYLPLSEVCTLRLEDSGMDEVSLRNIIDSCPKLEYFKYSDADYTAVPYRIVHPSTFTWGQAQQMLRSRRQTLKKVNFEFGKMYLATRDEPLGPGDYLGSFHDFEKLETLWVRTTSFGTQDDQTIPTFPANVQDLISKLPESLICLGFCGSHKNWNGIKILATAIREGHFPKLKTVMVEQGRKGFEESCEILTDVGVVCGFLNNELYDSFPRCLHRQYIKKSKSRRHRSFN